MDRSSRATLMGWLTRSPRTSHRGTSSRDLPGALTTRLLACSTGRRPSPRRRVIEVDRRSTTVTCLISIKVAKSEPASAPQCLNQHQEAGQKRRAATD